MSKTIRTSNNLTIDAAGDVIIDADNADIKLQDGGTEFGRISRVTSDLVVKSMGTNNDILFKGLDGSSTITALQLDMSENGNAIFSGNITATDLTANSLTTNVISSNGSNADISIQASGTGDVLLGAIRVNGTTLDSSDSTAININEALVVDGTGNFSGTLTTADITNTNNITTTQLDADGVRIKDNLITTISSNANLELAASGSGVVDVKSAMTGTSGVFSGNVTATDVTANSLTTNVISSNGSNADININASGTGDVVLSALRVNGTTLDSADSTKITVAEAVDVTGTLFSRGNVFGVQTLTGSGSTEVINLTDTVTLLVTTGSNQNFSLANGVEGQIKIISMKTDGGDGIVTPASFVNGTSITFNDVEDTVTMLYQSTGWVLLARQNAVVNA